jgi:hypothetical protein
MAGSRFFSFSIESINSSGLVDIRKLPSSQVPPKTSASLLFWPLLASGGSGLGWTQEGLNGDPGEQF